jgi:hypothetical protein
MNDEPSPLPASTAPRRPSKKEQITALFKAGIYDLNELAVITGARPSYVASVLQSADLLTGYFDLYTTSEQPMNVYSELFAKRLGYKDLEAARSSVELLDRYYQHFAADADRAGQHHALVLALTMFNRARWSNKPREANVFRRWLTARLKEADAAPQPAKTSRKTANKG